MPDETGARLPVMVTRGGWGRFWGGAVRRPCCSHGLEEPVKGICNAWQGAGAVPGMLRLWAFRYGYAGDLRPGGIWVRYLGKRPTLAFCVGASAFLDRLCVPLVILDAGAGS